MLLKVRRRRSVESTHGNGDPLPVEWVPEQERTACRAEPSPHVCGRPVPRHILLTCDDKGPSWNVRRGKVVAGLLPTLDFLISIARDAIVLFGCETSERIRQCEGETCALLFLDTSRSGDRRWCSMAGCGNKAKVADFRRRQRLIP